jgi:hypothetical protein
MFGFGFGKLLILVIVVVAVWHGFKLISRLDRKRKSDLSKKAGKSPDSVDSMEKCPVCGTYVVASQASNCGRQGCPY